MEIKIAFGCQAGVGKDTAVAYLMNKYGGEHLKFAQPLYDILYYAQQRCGLPNIKDRKFLQWIGTEWGRDHDPDLWINLLVNSITPSSNTFISDLRFPNEYFRLKKLGFTMIKLNRRDTNLTPVLKNHASETSMIQEDIVWDYEIDNNGSLDDLYQQLDSIQKEV